MEILAIAGFLQGIGLYLEAFGTYPTAAVGDLFKAGDFQALSVFDGLNKLAGFKQGVVGAGVEPGETAAEQTDIEIAAF